MAKQRLIYRAEHSKENPYFQMLRAAAQNRELTFEARGVLAYILSKPDDWKVQPSDLEQQCKKSVVYRVLAELIKHGYIDRVQERNDKKQIIAWHYLVHEYPLPKKQEVALQEVPKLEVEKADITEYREEQKKEITEKKPKAQPNPILGRWKQVAQIGDELLKVFKNDFVPVENQTTAAIEPYLIVAEDFTRIGTPVEHIAPLHRYIVERAERENWATFSVKVMPKYYTEYLKTKQKSTESRKQANIIPFEEKTPEERAALAEARKNIRPDWKRPVDDEEAAS